MESLCGTTYTFDTSFQMDSGTGITYSNLLDCSLTVTGPSNRFVLALITRFELEAAVTGKSKFDSSFTYFETEIFNL